MVNAYRVFLYTTLQNNAERERGAQLPRSNLAIPTDSKSDSEYMKNYKDTTWYVYLETFFFHVQNRSMLPVA